MFAAPVDQPERGHCSQFDSLMLVAKCLHAPCANQLGLFDLQEDDLAVRREKNLLQRNLTGSTFSSPVQGDGIAVMTPPAPPPPPPPSPVLPGPGAESSS